MPLLPGCRREVGQLEGLKEVFGLRVGNGEEARAHAGRRPGLPLAVPALSWGRCRTRPGTACHPAALVSILHITSQHEQQHDVTA